MFSVEKKYKELLMDVEEKWSSGMAEYVEKLTESRSSYVSIGKIKDGVTDALEKCRVEESEAETMVAASNQLGNFHVRSNTKAKVNLDDIESIEKLMSRIKEVSEFLKHSNVPLFSGKKSSLLSERSSLKLSDSSNLLMDDDMAITTAH
jgi:hypothetical protein